MRDLDGAAREVEQLAALGKVRTRNYCYDRFTSFSLRLSEYCRVFRQRDGYLKGNG